MDRLSKALDLIPISRKLREDKMGALPQDKIELVQTQTLKTFLRVNPTIRELAPESDACRLLWKREETILSNLGFSPEDFRGKKVLDAGCGSGDIPLLLSSWGGEVDAFDINPVSVDHARIIAEKFENGKCCTFKQGSVFEPPYSGQYDFVFCLGVLPHVGDPRKAFDTLSKFVRPGGYIYVMSINRTGFFLRWIKRAVVRLLSGGSDERKVVWAKRLFNKHLQRAARFGVRTEEQIAWDNFVAPHFSQDISEWMDWLETNGISYKSSFPSFYSLKLPSSSSGGIEAVTWDAEPSGHLGRQIKSMCVQARWAMAWGVGGMCSISFVGQKKSPKVIEVR